VRKRYRKLVQNLAGLAVCGLIAAIPLAVIAHMALQEHARRVDILDRGHAATALVTASAYQRRTCTFAYQFEYNGQTFLGGEGYCRLIPRHPRRSSLTARFDPHDPANSVPQGGDTWPAFAIVPVLLAPPVAVMGLIILCAILVDFRSRPGSAKRR